MCFGPPCCWTWDVTLENLTLEILILSFKSLGMFLQFYLNVKWLFVVFKKIRLCQLTAYHVACISFRWLARKKILAIDHQKNMYHLLANYRSHTLNFQHRSWTWWLARKPCPKICGFHRSMFQPRTTYSSWDHCMFAPDMFNLSLCFVGMKTFIVWNSYRFLGKPANIPLYLAGSWVCLYVQGYNENICKHYLQSLGESSTSFCRRFLLATPKTQSFSKNIIGMCPSNTPQAISCIGVAKELSFTIIS